MSRSQMSDLAADVIGPLQDIEDPKKLISQFVRELEGVSRKLRTNIDAGVLGDLRSLQRRCNKIDPDQSGSILDDLRCVLVDIADLHSPNGSRIATRRRKVRSKIQRLCGKETKARGRRHTNGKRR